MSLFQRFFGKSTPIKHPAPMPDSSGLLPMDATRPVRGQGDPAKDSPDDNAQPANRKRERMARRELLYVVVRDCMVHAGVLSSSYKFKVLSLDARGRQFLIMVDLAREATGETTQLAEVEALIAQAAKTRYDILVTAVYWRLNEHVAVGAPTSRSVARSPAHQGSPSRPAELSPMATPAPVASAPVRAAVPVASQAQPTVHSPAPVAAASVHGGRYEPIDADEVAAFKAALAAGTQPSVRPEPVAARSFDGAAKHGPQSYTLLTGFEDTEMPDEDLRKDLSGTQYGELR